VVRILYTAQGQEKVSEAGTVMRDGRSDSAGQNATSSNLGLGELGIRRLITSKCRRNGSFVQRLIDLDRELYERRADIGSATSQMRQANSKTCACGQRALYSVASVISTLGVSPRRQQCSPAVQLCESCIRELCDYVLPPLLRDALSDAYTAINNVFCDPRNKKEKQ
jgi:hypothetical protein